MTRGERGFALVFAAIVVLSLIRRDYVGGGLMLALLVLLLALWRANQRS